MVSCGDGMKDEDHGESCDPLSPEREPEPRLNGPYESAHFTPLNNLEKDSGNLRLCREIASDEASKKTSLTQL
jgi:hypothetical protein